MTDVVALCAAPYSHSTSVRRTLVSTLLRRDQTVTNFPLEGSPGNSSRWGVASAYSPRENARPAFVLTSFLIFTSL